jgi:hypothetical protein
LATPNYGYEKRQKELAKKKKKEEKLKSKSERKHDDPPMDDGNSTVEPGEPGATPPAESA